MIFSVRWTVTNLQIILGGHFVGIGNFLPTQILGTGNVFLPI